MFSIDISVPDAPLFRWHKLTTSRRPFLITLTAERRSRTVWIKEAVVLPTFVVAVTPALAEYLQRKEIERRWSQSILVFPSCGFETLFQLFVLELRPTEVVEGGVPVNPETGPLV